MGPSDIQLDPEYVRAMLNVLSEFGVGKFKCPAFTVIFAPTEVEDDSEPISTDVRGFQAESTEDDDDDDYDEEDDVASLHKTALRGFLPSLGPSKKPVKG